MTNPLRIAIHPGIFPTVGSDRVAREIRAGRVPQLLHYQGAAQAARWRVLYERWSPFVKRREYRDLFEQCFAEVASGVAAEVAVVGLGCGTGAKDLALIERLLPEETQASYVPIDVSVPLVTSSALAAGARLDSDRIHPLVADLAGANDLGVWLATELGVTFPRIFTFFSMLPNFMPGTILPQIAGWLRPEDRLLLSVNLEPGETLDAGMTAVLPQYDNAETRAWLFTFLEQGGIRPEDGELEFSVEPTGDDQNIRRIVARWRFLRPGRLHVLAEAIDFMAGDELELFFSCRYRADSVARHFLEQGIHVEASWLAPDGEEDIYICRAAGGR